MATTRPRSSDRILNNALGLFSSKGYDATSVREICEAAGITKPTLYHFYGSKEGVYRALVDGSLEDFRHRLTQDVLAPEAPVLRLQRVARAYFHFALDNPGLTRFLMNLVHNPPSSAPPTDFPRYYEEIVGLISQVVEQGVATGTFAAGPLELRMLVFMGTLAEAMHGYLICGRPALTPALADRLVETVIRGWCCPE